MPADIWTEEIARRYDAVSADMYAPTVLGPTVDFLADLARDGRALEFAIGTGRVAVPLAERGVAVSGIELSPAMVAELRRKVDESVIPVVIADMATASAPGRFALVYVVYNSLSNLLTQDEQVECFRNAARHLTPGGHLVVELFVPDLRRLPPGQDACAFAISDHHLGVDTYDLSSQRLVSHHFRVRDGQGTIFRSQHRFVWPAELDLMARLAGLRFRERVADWTRTPFTADSRSHVSVWQLPAA